MSTNTNYNGLSAESSASSGTVSGAESVYQEQINAAKNWAKKQEEILNNQTNFAIQQLEQQKAAANQSYLNEQSGAYADWQKQVGSYGANAESLAASGLKNSGYSESSRASMYNAYQNRVASAKSAFSQATQNYNNAINEARLQNSAKLAEIAYNALQQQLSLMLQIEKHKNSKAL